MSDRQRMWRGNIHYDCSGAEGVVVFSHIGHLSACGEWVDGGNVRWPRTAEWCPTEAEALARLAPEVAEIGARMLRQAQRLMTGVKTSEVTT